MSNHKLIVENWRKFLNDEEKEKKQELNEGVLTNLGLALGLGGSPDMQDQSSFESNIKGIELQVPGGKELKVAFSGTGQPDADITLRQLMTDLKKINTDEAHEAMIALADIVKISKKNFNVDLNVDRDGDGYADYTGVQNFDSYLGADGSQFLYDTVNPQQDTGDVNDVRSGKSANLDALTSMLVQMGSQTDTPASKAEKAKKILEKEKAGQGTLSDESRAALIELINAAN